MFRMKALGVAVAATTISLAAPSIAHAESSSYDDAKGDVFLQDDGGIESAPAGTSTNVDLDFSKVKHGRKAISVTATYYDLKRKTDESLIFGLQLLRAGGGEEVSGAVVFAGPGNRAGTVSYYHGDGTTPCAPTHDIDYVADTISITLPRSCFERPEWIRWTTTAQMQEPETGSQPATGMYFDQGRTSGSEGDTFSKRLYRGDGR